MDVKTTCGYHKLSTMTPETQLSFRSVVMLLSRPFLHNNTSAVTGNIFQAVRHARQQGQLPHVDVVWMVWGGCAGTCSCDIQVIDLWTLESLDPSESATTSIRYGVTSVSWSSSTRKRKAVHGKNGTQNVGLTAPPSLACWLVPHMLLSPM